MVATAETIESALVFSCCGRWAVGAVALEVGGLAPVADGNVVETRDSGRSWLPSANADVARVAAISAAAIALGLHRLLQRGAESIRFDSERCPFWRMKSGRAVTQKLLFSHLTDVLVKSFVFSAGSRRKRFAPQG